MSLAGPVRVASATVKVGHPSVMTPSAGDIATGALITMDGAAAGWDGVVVGVVVVWACEWELHPAAIPADAIRQSSASKRTCIRIPLFSL
jgi:hypothetical protein